MSHTDQDHHCIGAGCAFCLARGRFARLGSTADRTRKIIAEFLNVGTPHTLAEVRDHVEAQLHQPVTALSVFYALTDLRLSQQARCTKDGSWCRV